jgi:hypothetical protein
MKSKEHRERLMVKLRVLIATLNVGIAKTRLALETPNNQLTWADLLRLRDTMSRLENSHAICVKALRALEDSLQIITTTNIYDGEKKPITKEEIAEVDWDELMGQL